MKLGKDVLLEIVALVQDGIVNGKDISENLRQIDIEEVYEPDVNGDMCSVACLTKDYKNRK